MDRTIGALGGTTHESTRVKALLKLLEKRTSDKWVFVESGDAQVMLVDGDEATGHFNVPDGAMKIVLFSGKVSSAGNSGDYSLQRPIRPGSLLDLLNQLSTRLEKKNARPYKYRGVEYG